MPEAVKLGGNLCIERDDVVLISCHGLNRVNKRSAVGNYGRVWHAEVQIEIEGAAQLDFVLRVEDGRVPDMVQRP